VSCASRVTRAIRRSAWRWLGWLADFVLLAPDDLPEGLRLDGATRYRGTNLRTQRERVIGRASANPWPKLFQNLRASRATKLAAEFPAHGAAEWRGHSALVAQSITGR
jgi:hypothetical protein